MDLLELAVKYPTDKGAWHHNYLSTYQRELGRFVGRGIRLLELGVQRGWSVLLWRDWLENAEIHGADIHRPSSRLLRMAARRIVFHRVDCSDRAALEWEFGGWEFDVVIDDCSHLWPQQWVSYEVLWPRVRSGGLYVVEDVRSANRRSFLRRVPSVEVIDLSQGRGRRQADSVLLLFRKAVAS